MRNVKSYSIACALTLGLVACGAEVQTEQPTDVSSKKATHSHSYQKPGAPIEMTYQVLTQAPQVGDEIEIEVSFDSSIKSMISTQMNAAKGLEFLNENTSWQSFANKSGLFESLPRLRVIAPSEGLFYINLVASIEEDGKVQSRPFVIPVKVGNGEVKLESTGQVITDENGQKLIVHKAQTSKEP